jgi:hypothetical protein
MSMKILISAVAVTLAWLPVVAGAAPAKKHHQRAAQPVEETRPAPAPAQLNDTRGNAALGGNNANSAYGSNSANENANGRTGGGFGGN